MALAVQGVQNTSRDGLLLDPLRQIGKMTKKTDGDGAISSHDQAFGDDEKAFCCGLSLMHFVTVLKTVGAGMVDTSSDFLMMGKDYLDGDQSFFQISLGIQIIAGIFSGSVLVRAMASSCMFSRQTVSVDFSRQGWTLAADTDWPRPVRYFVGKFQLLAPDRIVNRRAATMQESF